MNEQFDLLIIMCMPITIPMEKKGSEVGLCEHCEKTVIWITPKKKELREKTEASRYVCPLCVGILCAENGIENPMQGIIDIEKHDPKQFYDENN